MRITITIFIGLVLIGSSVFGQNTTKNDIQGFNKFLGKEKANVLNAAVESFEQFLKKNYSEFDSQSMRTEAYLRQIENNFESDSSWIFSTSRNKKIIEDFETSGLRKEIWVYGYEDYEPKYDIYDLLTPGETDTTITHDTVELDLDLIEEEIIPLSNIDSVEIAKRKKEMEEKRRNSLHFNTHGEFLFALTKYTSGDTFMQEYADMKAYDGNISPVIIASGLLRQEINFNDPFMKRILVTEFHFGLMKWNIEQKE